MCVSHTATFSLLCVLCDLCGKYLKINEMYLFGIRQQRHLLREVLGLGEVLPSLATEGFHKAHKVFFILFREVQWA